MERGNRGQNLENIGTPSKAEAYAIQSGVSKLFSGCDKQIKEGKISYTYKVGHFGVFWVTVNDKGTVKFKYGALSHRTIRMRKWIKHPEAIDRAFERAFGNPYDTLSIHY